MSRSVFIKTLGQMKYCEVWELQKKLAQEVYDNVKSKRNPNHKLIIVEHFPEEEEQLKKLGAEFYRTNRGGLITFHGPGQLTVYPILHLRSFGKGIRWYVSALERTVIKCLREFNIDSHTTSDTGIWIGDRKICAIGIQGRHVTTHGLGLNCNTNLKWFDHIVPCGIEGKGVTSVSNELSTDTPVHQVLPNLLKSFAHVFEADLIED